jgi:hypothetical protein
VEDQKGWECLSAQLVLLALLDGTPSSDFFAPKAPSRKEFARLVPLVVVYGG